MASTPSCTKHHSVGSSDKRRMHQCLGIGSSGAPDPKRFQGAATPIFSFSLSSLEPKSMRMIILTIILVQVLCCHSIIKIIRNSINGAMFVSVRKLSSAPSLFTNFKPSTLKSCATGGSISTCVSPLNGTKTPVSSTLLHPGDDAKTKSSA